MSSVATSAVAPLRNPAFMACWTAGTIAHSANWMQSIAVPILVYDMTGSASWLGIAAVAGQAPALIGSPLGGAWADRYSKRFILLSTLAVKACVAFSFFMLHAAGELTPPVMVGLLVVSGFGSTVNIATWQPFVAEIVPRHEIAAAYRLNAIQFNTSRAVGPALAGIIIGSFGVGAAFLVNAIAYAPLAITLAFVRPSPRMRAAGEGAIRDLVAAARVVLGDRRLWVPTLIVTVTSMLGQGLHPLMAAIGTELYHTDEKGIGYLMSSIGISSVIAAVLVIWVGERVSRSALVRVGYAVYVVALWLVAATEAFWVGIAGFALTGVAHVLVHVSSTISVQVNVDEALRGRVTAIYLMGIILGIPIGAQLGGLLADATSMATVVRGAALGLAGFAIAGTLFLRGFRDLDHG